MLQIKQGGVIIVDLDKVVEICIIYFQELIEPKLVINDSVLTA